ncbi:hypothetical protein [Arthrobacter sp. KBS0703]|uniref:hypothetical protein n=1 Tax=Arthrobacter sp. KBS0703 TaxID=1955698 RepID=UPI0021B13F7A|nr:hypothetical protein [Arthrobacter sp. KBS0703]
MPPPIRATSMMARGTVRRGAMVSSVRVVTASSPRSDSRAGGDGGEAGGVVQERLSAGQSSRVVGGHNAADGQRHKEHEDQQLAIST